MIVENQNSRPSPRVRDPHIPESGKHRYIHGTTELLFHAPLVVKRFQPVAGSPRRSNTYRPGVSSSQQLMARVRGGAA